MGGAGWRWWRRPSGAVNGRAAVVRPGGRWSTRCFHGWPAGRCRRSRSRPARPMAPAIGGGDGEPGSASAPARRQLILGPGPGGSWREAAGATGTCGSAPSPSPASTVTGPGPATRSCGAAHAPWSGLDWEAKLSHLEDLCTHGLPPSIRMPASSRLRPPTTWSRGCCGHWRPSCEAAAWLPRRGRHGPGGPPAGPTAERLGLRPVDAIVTLARPPWPPDGATSPSRCSPPPTAPPAFSRTAWPGDTWSSPASHHPPSPPRSPVGRPGRRCRGTPAIPAQPVVS
jgi:hypothetical protein